MTVQNRIFFTYLYLDNTTGMTHLKTYLRCWLMLIFCILESCKCDFLHIAPFVYTKYILNNYGRLMVRIRVAIRNIYKALNISDHRSNYRSNMSLLQLVESQIGTVYSWPRLILKYLFCEPATFLSTLAIINFFCGNGVPRDMAVQLFRLCKEKATDQLIDHF